MIIRELKEILNKYPDDMEVGLWEVAFGGLEPLEINLNDKGHRDVDLRGRSIPCNDWLSLGPYGCDCDID